MVSPAGGGRRDVGMKHILDPLISTGHGCRPWASCPEAQAVDGQKAPPRGKQPLAGLPGTLRERSTWLSEKEFLHQNPL